MRNSRRWRPAAALLAVALLATACSGDDDDAGGDEGSQSAVPSGESPYTTDLSDVCPDPFVVQKDWLAEVEHAAFYQLIGPGGEMSENQYRGPLGDTGIDLQIIDGGPGLGQGQNAIQTLTAGNLRFNVTADMAFVSSDDLAIYSAEYPAVGVVAPLDRSPQMLFWDPERYQDGFENVDQLIALNNTDGARIYVRSIDDSFGRYLVEQGVPAELFVEGYQGDGENFVANDGAWLNQGYSSNEVWDFENGREWERPVDYVYVSELGYDFYPSVPSVAADRLEELGPCLERLVPLIQQAQVDYIQDPAMVNQLLTDYNDGDYGAGFWKTPLELNEAGAQIMAEDDLVGNGNNATLGDFEMERVQTTIDNIADSLDDRANPEVAPEDIVTNAFIDESIGIPSE
jgi:hypothetical protein